MAQWYLSVSLCGAAAATAALALALWLLRARPWCSCEVCLAYATSSWEAEFDNLCDWFAHLLRESPGRTVHIHVLGNTITANRANVEHMLRSRFENYPKGRPFASVLGDFLGRGIFNSDGHQWLFQRKLASLELGSTSVRSYAYGIIREEIGDRLLPLLAQTSAGGSDRALDLQDVFRRFSFDAICKISFGLDPGCLKLSLPISEFAAAFDLASGLSAARAATVTPAVWKLKRLLNIGSERRLRRAIRLVDELAREVIRQRREELESGGGATGRQQQRHDLLTRFMASVSDEDYLRDIVVSFLLAGRDTVSSALTTFFYLLSRHPDAEEALLQEIRRASPSSSSSSVPTFEELREMPYLHAAIYESLRLYPPVQLDSKFASGDDVLPDGTYIRRGTRVSFNPYAMGRLPEAWGKDCMEFRPDRWLNSQTGSFVPPESAYKFPVFQAGLRVCLGQELAIMECKAVVAAVVKGFSIQPLGRDRPIKFSPGLTATVRGGLPAVVRQRDMW